MDDNVRFVRGVRPGYIGGIARMHGEYYATAWGSDVAFEALMAKEIIAWWERYDEHRDLLLTAHVGDILAGSVAIDGSQSERPGWARLRWFLLEPRFQGQGIGKSLIQDALAFCAAPRFSGTYLWTVEGLPQSLRLYEQNGFAVVGRESDDRYSVPHVNLCMERRAPNGGKYNS
ncbi:MAG: GNAT family N-acetyltransferase [Akkermansiaceae bacterium]|nr:GNAT family N-acetyltransferase [Armatimonadota bacterium]